jgi:archaemetzincin
LKEARVGETQAIPEKPASFYHRPLQATWQKCCALLVILIAAAALLIVLWPWLFGTTLGGGQPVSLLARHMLKAEYASLPPEDEAGFERLDPEMPGPWLASFREPVQSLESYKARKPARPSAGRKIISLQPLGPLTAGQQRLIGLMKEYAGIFFQLPARVEPPLPLELPDGLEGWTRRTPGKKGLWERQYDAGIILDRLLGPRVPADAASYMAITAADLMTSNTGFVMGLGAFDRRIGVYSLSHYYPGYFGREERPGDEKLLLRRACKTLNHEMGHIFGIGHCVFYLCSMNGGMSIAESDASPMEYCPLCHRKLAWNIGFDTVRRMSDLRGFYRRHGLEDDAAFMGERLRHWKEVVGKEARPGGK